MRLVTNSKNEIVGYAISGEIENAIEFEGSVPEDFYAAFKPRLYLLLDGAVVLNQKYVEPEIGEPEPKLTEQDKINAHFLKSNLDLELQLKELKSNG